MAQSKKKKPEEVTEEVTEDDQDEEVTEEVNPRVAIIKALIKEERAAIQVALGEAVTKAVAAGGNISVGIKLATDESVRQDAMLMSEFLADVHTAIGKVPKPKTDGKGKVVTADDVTTWLASLNGLASTKDFFEYFYNEGKTFTELRTIQKGAKDSISRVGVATGVRYFLPNVDYSDKVKEEITKLTQQEEEAEAKRLAKAKR